MPIKIWLRVGLLAVALTMTIIAMTLLKQGHMSAFWTSLGFNPTGQRINWCSERVGSIYLYENKAKLHEEGGKWLWEQTFSVPLDYLRVEKWFAQYCQVDIQTVTGSESGSAVPVFEAKFINGEHMTLYSYANGDFKMGDQVFKSETLRQALKELLAFATKME